MAGWGKTEALAYNSSSQLRKASVTLFSYDTCSNIYKEDSRRLDKGIVEELQLCAGSDIDESNTCEVIIYYFVGSRAFNLVFSL